MISSLGEQAGITLPELIVAIAIMGIVLAGVTSTLVSATRHEASLNGSFQAQESARLALSKFRDEVHCASAVTPTSGATSSITLALPSGCTSGSGSVTWCTVASGSRFNLWRIPGASCSTVAAGSIKWAQNLTASSVFTPDATVHTGAPQLPDVGFNLAVAVSGKSYRLTDTIFLRNGSQRQ